MPPAVGGYAVLKALAQPDAWLRPELVVEVRAQSISLSATHSCLLGRAGHEAKGISLRFPTFVRVRDDKAPDAATSEDELAQLAGFGGAAPGGGGFP